MLVTEKITKLIKLFFFVVVTLAALEAASIRDTVLRLGQYFTNYRLGNRSLCSTVCIDRSSEFRYCAGGFSKISAVSNSFHSQDFYAKKPKKVIEGYNRSLGEPLLNVMNELNQLPIRFPEAISLASGRPADEFCRPEIAASAIEAFKQYSEKCSSIPTNRLLGQYGKTSGIINEIIAKHIKLDENIDVDPDSIVTTVGFQEAAVLCVLTLFEENDVLLIPDPIFIGISGIASLVNVHTEPIPYKGNLKVDDIKEVLDLVKASGKKAKALYVIPDFSNPNGDSLSLKERGKLLALARENNFLILEDNAYSMFRYEGEKIPSLKSLDKDGVVIYLGTFAKTIFPALRMGYVVADQYLKDKYGKHTSVASEMAKVKSYITVNTPALDQAVVGGILIKNNYSLNGINEEKRKYYRNNRDTMVDALNNEFKGYPNVSWSVPEGGFFLTVTLPFSFNQETLEECAKNNRVIVFPESLLSLSQNPSNRVRLAFTNVPPEQIKIAIKRFADYVKEKMK